MVSLEKPDYYCEVCGKQYKWYEVHLKNHYHTVPVPDCDCMDKQNELENARLEAEQKKNITEKLFKNSMMTPYFKDKTFEKLDERNTKELEACKQYAESFNPVDSKGIQAIGNVGTGKTTLLAAIANALINKGYKCLFSTFADLLDRFTNHSFNNAGDVSPLLDWICRFDFVVLDDLGRENLTDKRKELAFRIIDTLLNYKVVVSITANPEMLAKLRKITEFDAILDRLREMCPLKLNFKGSSYRGM